jgi:hypothetical protein
MVYVMKLLLLLPVVMLAGCSCKPTIEYVDRVVYIDPVVPEVVTTEYPSVELNVWADYHIYKLQCERQIDMCNADKSGIIRSLQITTESTGND